MINSLLDSYYTKNQPLYRFSTFNLTQKQQTKLKSSIKDINKCLSEITKYFYPLYQIFSPGSRIVNYFSSSITFHSLPLASDKDLYKHIQDLNHIFCQSQTNFYSATVITNGGVKKSNVATAVAHIWKDNSVTKQLQIQTMNIISIKAKLIAICISLIPTMENNDTCNIIVLTNSISVANKVFKSYISPAQNIILLLTSRIKSFLKKDKRNAIHFWYCPSKVEWPKYKLVDNKVKVAANTPTLSSRCSYLLSRKKECNNILKKWQTSFATSHKKSQLSLDFEDKEEYIIKPTYAKGRS